MKQKKITKKLFVEIIQAIQKQRKKDIANSEKLGELFPSAFTANLLYDNEALESILIKTLEHIFNDEENKWIDYFIYELDFGKEYKTNSVIDKNGNEIKLSNPKELYELLKN